MSRPNPRRALGASVLAATALAGLSAGPSSASTIPRTMEVTRALPFSCALPGSLVEDPPATDAQVTSTDGTDYPAGYSFPSGAKGYATVLGLGGALDRAEAREVSYSGTWRWHVGASTAPWSGNDTPFSASLTIPDGGGPADTRVAFAVAAPTSVLQLRGNQAHVDALSYVFRATTASGRPADFGFIKDGDGDPTTLVVSCTGPRTLVSSVFAVTPPPTPPVTPRATPAVVRPVSLSGGGRLAVSSPLAGTTPTYAYVRGELDTSTGSFTGTTTIGSSGDDYTVAGFLPVRATIVFTAVGAASGTSTPSGSFTLTTLQDIALKKATLFGLPIGSGTCHTASPATITLKSESADATFVKGGAATGAFALGRLTGCSTFGNLFGTNGGRATLRLVLAPYPVQPPTPPTPTATPWPPFG